jgi:hypothetical protein
MTSDKVKVTLVCIMTTNFIKLVAWGFKNNRVKNWQYRN